MSRYLAISISPRPEGHRYLARGREVTLEQASRYCSPSAAWRAIDAFLGAPHRDRRTWAFDVIDERTGKSVLGLADDIVVPVPCHAQEHAPETPLNRSGGFK